MAKGGIESLYNRVGKELHSKKTLDNVPVRWRSAPNHPETQLSYITDEEAALLKQLDIHGSGVRYKHHIGPQGIPSYNGAGSGDSAGGGNSSGGDNGGGGNTGGGGDTGGGGSTGGGGDTGGSPAGDASGGFGGGVGGDSGTTGGSPAGDASGGFGGGVGGDTGTTGGSPAGDASGGFGGGVGTGGGTTGGSPAGDGPGVMGGGSLSGTADLSGTSSLATAASTSPDMDSLGMPDPSGLSTSFTGPGTGSTNMAAAIGAIGAGNIGAYSGPSVSTPAASVSAPTGNQAATVGYAGSPATSQAAPATAQSSPNAFAGMTGAQLGAQMDAMAQASNVSVGPTGGLVGAAAPGSYGSTATSSAGVVSGSSVADAAAGVTSGAGPAQSAGSVAGPASSTTSAETSAPSTTPGFDGGYSADGGGITDLVQNTAIPYPVADAGIVSLAPQPAPQPQTTGVNVLAPTVPTAFNISDFLSKPSQPVQLVYPYTYSDYLPVQGYRA